MTEHVTEHTVGSMQTASVNLTTVDLQLRASGLSSVLTGWSRIFQNSERSADSSSLSSATLYIDDFNFLGITRIPLGQFGNPICHLEELI